MRKWMMAVAASVLPLLSVSPAKAQSQPETAPDGRTHSEVDGLFITQAPNEPFSARQIGVWSRVLSDGTVVNSKYYTIVARDSQGRVHRENRRIVPADADKDSALNYTFVLDPAARTRTECHPDTQVCRITSYRPVTELRVGTVRVPNPDVQRESLGNQVMESLDVVGTKETQTIKAGEIGNVNSFDVTKEIWYSPKLQVNVSVTRNDPRVGQQVLKLTQVVLEEPDAKLFEVPAGYRVVDERKGKE